MTDCPERKNKLEINEADDAFIVYDPELDRVHSLNHTAVFVLELCDGNHTVDEIIEITADAFHLETSPTSEVRDAIASFGEQGLLKS